jgi:hypothetical protein
MSLLFVPTSLSIFLLRLFIIFLHTYFLLLLSIFISFSIFLYSFFRSEIVSTSLFKGKHFDFYLLFDWLRAGRQRGRSSSPGRVKNFLFSTSFRPVLGPTQPPIQWVPRALSLGAKRPVRAADHSPPTSAEVKKTWIYTFTPPYTSIAQCLIS